MYPWVLEARAQAAPGASAALVIARHPLSWVTGPGLSVLAALGVAARARRASRAGTSGRKIRRCRRRLERVLRRVPRLVQDALCSYTLRRLVTRLGPHAARPVSRLPSRAAEARREEARPRAVLRRCARLQSRETMARGEIYRTRGCWPLRAG